MNSKALDFSKNGGLVTVVVQDDLTGAVLMVAHADREAIDQTVATGEMHFRSRSRGLWRKGGTSGNVQRVVSLTPDCDGDAILARVVPSGPACHTGSRSCFPSADGDALSRLNATIENRARDGSAESYTRRLLNDRNLRLKKIGEEAAELVVAAGDGDGKRAVEEAADLVYHTLVLLRALGVGLDEVRGELVRRRDAPTTTTAPDPPAAAHSRSATCR
jgi:phosphoribosyl-ATP pyrophosphohydrolase/phosphoribosyl-AMP cyclohydrolase